MKLKQFLKDNDISIPAFAESIGLAAFSVERYIKGRLPQPDVMASIYKATKGAVQPNDFYVLDVNRSGKKKAK